MKSKHKSKSIFRSLFIPLIIIMLFQALTYYMAAVYGGIEQSLSRNAVDILSGNLNSRKTEIETVFNNRWTALDDCISELDKQYAVFEETRGTNPFALDIQNQIDFLASSGSILINTLRFNKANGIFIILNDEPDGQAPSDDVPNQKYGLCIRDMDPESNYSGTEDLLLERAPSSIVKTLDCILDSWWEARYSFTDYYDGVFYYAPLFAAYENKNSKSNDLAYLSDVHQISGADPKMISYSVPLLSETGVPYAVLGVELSSNYLSSLLPSGELYDDDKGCYILALHDSGTDEFETITGSGVLYNRCFGDDIVIKRGDSPITGGFSISGQENTHLYATEAVLDTYDNNNPFESKQLVLLAAVEHDSLFSYISHIKTLLLIVALLSLALGVAALIVVSRRFAAPVTELAEKAVHMDNSDYSLEHIGITEIDQLVDSIETLSINVSRNNTRTEFFSRMSHDMRTPMNAIISFSSHELLENAEEKTKDDYLRKIHESGIYLLGLINDVLDMTKIESSKTELCLSKVRALTLFDTPISIIEKLAQEKSIVFLTEIELSPELFIMADEQRLNQVVMNLLSNAIKFSHEGGKVVFSAQIVEDNTLCLTVKDAGIGISSDFMRKLYTPFAQESNIHEGTGLGLSIAKKLVELMNGTIECQSKKEKGTIFTVTLPISPANDDNDDKATLLPEEAQNVDFQDFRGKRILVCEDNAINISIITMLLERVGIKVDIAENGKRGVELFEASKPGAYSAILMDIRMPVMDGHEAAKAIRQLNREDGTVVPIIAMTADAFVEDEQTSLLAGMNAHLSKPIDTKKLYNTLREYICDSKKP